MWKYIEISPGDGIDAYTRGMLITEELFSLSRPRAVRNPNDKSNRLFEVFERDGKVYMQIILDLIIPVHPQNSVDNLALLFPNLSAEEKSNLVEFITHSQHFQFQQIIPSGTVILDKI